MDGQKPYKILSEKLTGSFDSVELKMYYLLMFQTEIVTDSHNR